MVVVHLAWVERGAYKMLNIQELEEEAVEVNRRQNDWLRLKQQHRKSVMDLLELSDDKGELKKLVRILMLTTNKEQG